MSKEMRLQKLENQLDVEVKLGIAREKQTNNRLDTIEKKVNDLMWVLKAVGMIEVNEYVGVRMTHLQPLFSITQMKEKLEKLEDYLDIELKEEPAKKYYFRRIK